MNKELIKNKLRDIDCDNCLYHMSRYKPLQLYCYIYTEKPNKPCNYYIHKDCIDKELSIDELDHLQYRIFSEGIGEGPITFTHLDLFEKRLESYIKSKGEDINKWRKPLQKTN